MGTRTCAVRWMKAIAVALACVGPVVVQATAQQPAAPARTAPAIHQAVKHTLTHADTQRHYLLSLPPGHKPGEPLPLVLSFHGGGGHMEVQADDRLYGLVSHAALHGYAIVFPNGFSRLRSGRLATWNAGDCCGAAQRLTVDDVGFVRALVADVQRQVSIDPLRIYAQGMSNGGMLAYRLACEMADTFAAVAAVAATDGTPACEPSRPVPVLHIHAADDDHVRFHGGAGSASIAGVDFRSVPDTLSGWEQRNGCTEPTRRVLEVPGARCESRAPCREGSEVMLCVTDSGGHAWPGGRKARGGAPGSTALNANDVIWSFFSRHARRP